MIIGIVVGFGIFGFFVVILCVGLILLSVMIVVMWVYVMVFILLVVELSYVGGFYFFVESF